MIKGKVQEQRVCIDKPSINYRKIDALNQTMLKVFDSDPVRFFEEFKLGKKRKDKKSLAIQVGDLVDFFVLQCRGDEHEFNNRFDERFCLFSGSKGSAQVFVLADYLFEITENCTNERGVVSVSFEERFKEALAKCQQEGLYKGKTVEKAMEEFEKKGQEYFELRLASVGKTVVDEYVLDKSLIVGRALLTDNFTKELFEGSEDKEIIPHFPIEWVHHIDEKRSINCKAEIDKLEIDHVKKIIQPDDVKTTYDNESFDYMYIKNGYYLQNAFYYKAVKYWAATESGLLGYKVPPMRFIVGDTSMNNRRPLVYVTSEKDIQAGWNGFDLKGNHYRGAKELMDEIAWCEENGIWNCSKENYEKNGKMQLAIKYES